MEKEMPEQLRGLSQHKLDSLVAATWEMFNRILATPGGRELIEKKKAELGLIKGGK